MSIVMPCVYSFLVFLQFPHPFLTLLSQTLQVYLPNYQQLLPYIYSLNLKVA